MHRVEGGMRRILFVGAAAIAVIVSLGCRKRQERGDWGAPCTGEDGCRESLHCSMEVKDRKGQHYCTAVCEDRWGVDDCEERGAPKGWQCWPIMDPHDGESQMP